jgi:predicted nucleic acid-binding protein
MPLGPTPQYRPFSSGDNAAMNASAPAAPAVVLDTNAVLDWLVFRNPEFDPLAAAIVAGDLRWIATATMREELAHVLGHGHLDAWQPDPPAIWAHWDRHCALQPAPAPAGPPGRLRCSDPDDQPFIDLARAAGAHWLISRDRAVLKLARRLREHGVAVVPPGAWRPPDPAG